MAEEDQPSPREPTKEERPSPSESPSSSEAASAASSKASPAGSSFIGDPGPDFDPEARTPGPEPPPREAEIHALPELPPEWEEQTVRSILVAQGQVLHGAVGIAEQDWSYTEGDLKAIAPPLTRILNRYPTTRAAAGTGDEIALVIGLGGYVSRSYMERREVQRAVVEEPEVPVTGEPAEPGTGPPEPGSEQAESEGVAWRT